MVSVGPLGTAVTVLALLAAGPTRDDEKAACADAAGVVEGRRRPGVGKGLGKTALAGLA